MNRNSPLLFSPGAAGPVLAEGEDWPDLALCAETDPEVFFPEKGASSREAKRVCMACPVRAACLGYALANGERFGIWGGLSERERRKLARDRHAVTTAGVKKTCTGCRAAKPLTAFTYRANSKDGLEQKCKDCRYAAAAQRKAAA